jgi:predicted enzyme related to lactoylglutathione lyase
MTTPDQSAHGAPCWVDLLTSDADRSRSFYGELFGWKALEPDPQFGGYFMFTKDDTAVAGGMGSGPESPVSDLWSVYLTSDDAGRTLAAAASEGGQVLMPVMEVADIGTMGMVADAGGAAVGIWQPGTFHGLELGGQEGTPVWFELHTRDYEAAVAFYRDVFDWDAHTMSDTPEFRYTTLGEGQAAKAGIMDAAGYLPDGVPAHWSVYFAVTDTDAALAQVVGLGGAVVTAPRDTPYGRLATAADSNGAQFNIMAES